MLPQSTWTNQSEVNKLPAVTRDRKWLFDINKGQKLCIFHQELISLLNYYIRYFNFRFELNPVGVDLVIFFGIRCHRDESSPNSLGKSSLYFQQIGKKHGYEF